MFISFLGSVQLGPVNLVVIKTTLEKGMKPALFIAFGGVIPELIYSWLAIYAAKMSFLNEHIYFLKWAIVPMFLGIGCMNLLQKNKLSATKETNKTYNKNIAIGFFLALFNIQLFPFWLSVIIFLKTLGMMQTQTLYTNIAFTLGTALGAFALLATLIYFTNWKKDYFVNKLKSYNLNTIFGYLFLILGLVQLINLLLFK